MKYEIAEPGHKCVDCEAEDETVPASYRLRNGDYVCDSHLDIRRENLPWTHR